MSGAHPVGEDLQDLLDGRVAGPARAALKAHVAQCALCREELAVLEGARTAARALPPLAQPADLALRIARALDAADRAAAGEPTRRTIHARWPFVAAALLVVAGVVALSVRRSAPADVPAAVAEDFARYRDGSLRLELQTGDPTTLERFFAERGIGFATRVFDLAMMRYRLSGGRVHRLAGRPSALFAYAGPDATPLICEMYRGTLTELPRAAEERVHDGITFRIYRASGMTVVLWQEGPVVCVLASEGTTEQVIQLAYAKAAKL